MTMKDIGHKSDKVASLTTEYLKQRSFEANSVSTDLFESEESSEDKVVLLPEEQVGLKELLSPTSPNSFTFSTTSSHYSFIDQQYLRLKSWMTEASEPCRSELSQVLFPLFVHLFLELLSGAGKQAAKVFFGRHHQVFRVNRDYEQTLKQVWSAAGEVTNSPIIQSLKTGKYIVRLSELTLNYFLRYLQSSSNPTLLQIFNNFLEVELSELCGSQSFATFRSADEGSEDDSDHALSSKPSHYHSADCSMEELNHIKEVISNVRNAKPFMPSVCVYSVYNSYNGLTCARINEDSRLLGCGFEDSVIKLWRLTPPPQNFGLGVDLPEETKSYESILFCDFMKCEDEEENSGVEKEEEEETKTLGGRHISGGEFCTLRGHRGPVFDTAFTHCSSYLLSVGDDASMRLWDLKEQRTIALYQGHHYPIWCLDVSPHTIYIATGSFDETLKLWATECTYPIRAFLGHTGSVDCVSFHPNCSYVASGSHDRAIRLWQVNDAAVARILLQHSSPVKCLKFSPNGKYIASGSETGEIFIWDLVAGKVLVNLGATASEGSSSSSSFQGGDPVVSLDWSKDSKVLYSSSSDGYVKGTFLNFAEGNEASEVETVYCGSNSSASTLIHMSLNTHNFISSVVAVHGER